MYNPQKDKHRKIGLEYEFLAIDTTTGFAATRAQMKSVWRKWSEQDHVSLYADPGTGEVIGVDYTQEDGRTFPINSDAGVAVVEFGFLPFETLVECQKNMDTIVSEFQSAAKEFSVALTGMGMQPKTPGYFPDLKTEKTWYRGVLVQMPHFASGHHLFHNIAAHQACVDMTYEESVDVVNSLCAISGVTIALFANSGAGEYNLQSHHEMREYRWDSVVEGFDERIQKISGIPKKPFQTFQDYLTYNWSIYFPSLFRGKSLHTIASRPIVDDYLRSGKQETFDVTKAVPSHMTPEMQDVNQLNMYIWIQARPKIFFDESQSLESILEAYDNNTVDEYAAAHATKLYVETRNMAAQPWEDRMAAPAYMLGLVENIDELKTLVEGKTWDEWISLRKQTIEKSLEVDEATALAQDILDIARRGLEKRGLGEEEFLDPLYKRLEVKMSPAMVAREQYDKDIDSYIASTIIPV